MKKSGVFLLLVVCFIAFVLLEDRYGFTEYVMGGIDEIKQYMGVMI